MQPDAETLLFLAITLRKPISYFFPGQLGEMIRLENINSRLHELLLVARNLNDDDIERMLIQVRALAQQ